MGRYRTPTPIGYKGPFRNMADIYQEYRNTLMNKGPYKAYFSSRASYGESPRKFSKSHYSREPLSSLNSGERERKEQQHEIKLDKTPETKTETSQKIEDSQKIETPKETEPSQKIETSQKIEQAKETSETENELSYEKLGLPYERNPGQTDISPRNRPSPYYDKSELRW